MIEGADQIKRHFLGPSLRSSKIVKFFLDERVGRKTLDFFLKIIFFLLSVKVEQKLIKSSTLSLNEILIFNFFPRVIHLQLDAVKLYISIDTLNSMREIENQKWNEKFFVFHFDKFPPDNIYQLVSVDSRC